MQIIRPSGNSLILRDERFAHFLPLMLAPKLFGAAGKAIGWLGKKAKAVVSRAPVEEAPQEETPEDEPLEDGDDEMLGEAMDISVSGNQVKFDFDGMDEMSDEEVGELADVLASEVHDALTNVRDADESPYEYDFDEVEPRFAHFKKLKKKLGKLKKLKGLAKLASGFVPGGGVVTSLAGMSDGDFDIGYEERDEDELLDFDGDDLETGGPAARAESIRAHRLTERFNDELR